jgi:hypothetical protein
MAKQRETKNLGFNRSRNNPSVYDYIENTLGIKEKYCGRGRKGKLGKYGLVHKGKNPLPIREFYLLNAYVNPITGKVVVKSKDGLQGACIQCDKAFRRARINRWSKKYSNMTKKEINEEYRKNYGELKHCTPCGKDKSPEEFPISITMETGLHNSCIECTKSYTESVGGRWEIYSPDGHVVMTITNKDVCQVKNCKSRNLSKDHIFPIAKGGTDNSENLQVLFRHHNSSKSDTVVSSMINSINDIKDRMICKRYLHILQKARKEKWSLKKFELEITKAVREFIIWKRNLSDEQLKNFFQSEKERNNRKHSVEHAMKKFRQYCETAILEANEYIERNNRVSKN